MQILLTLIKSVLATAVLCDMDGGSQRIRV